MKFYATFLIAAAVVTSSLAARAQSPQGEATVAPLQTPDLFGPMPLDEIPAASPTPAPATTPAPGAEATSETAAPAPTPPRALKKGTAEQLRQAVRLRELKTLALEDPEVQAWKEKAACTKTEEARRVAMRNHYTLLYTKMEKLDPTLFPLLEGLLHDILASYELHSVRPSVLVEAITPLPGSNSKDHAAMAGLQEPPKKKQSILQSIGR